MRAHPRSPGWRLIVGATLVLAHAGAIGPFGPALSSLPQNASTRLTRAIKGFEKLQAWARAAHEHTPGEWDEPARMVAAWSLSDYRWTRVDLAELGKLLANPTSRIIRYDDPMVAGLRTAYEDRVPKREIELANVPALLMLSENMRLGRDQTNIDEALRQLQSEVTRLMKLAAMLHADIAVLAPPRPDLRALWTPGPMLGTLGYVKAADGAGAGLDSEPVDWEMGRTALNLVRPLPADDEFVRVWYRATSAYQEQRRQWAYLGPHLAHARALLPDDAYVHFYSGVMQENLAAPPVQAFVQTTTLVNSLNYAVGSSLAAAEVSLRRALELDPKLATARVRLARVVSLRGRPAQAVAELRAAIPSLTSDVDRYYAHLFLGADEQFLGHHDDARTAFQLASTLFPKAQSPLLALGQLAWQQGDRTAARAASLRLADLPSLPTARLDPWWDYDIAPVADAPDLLSAVRALTRTEKEKSR